MIKICATCDREYVGEAAQQEFCPRDGGELVLQRDPLVGRVLGQRYQILRLLGAGGMGRVYLARQLSMDRDVALKILPPSLVKDQRAIKRFLKEVRAVSLLSHPNAITVHDFGHTEEGIPFLAMEYIHGLTLDELIKIGGPLPLSDFFPIMSQICAALEEAHNQGVIHRDLKPGNVMLLEKPGQRAFVKVLDFGMAKIRVGEGLPTTTGGLIFGTPQYMAPEQVKDDPVDARTDIYAVGIVMYELLTGRPPFDADTPLQTVRMQLEKPPPAMRSVLPALQLPAQLELLVAACLEKVPAKRPQTAVELRKRLNSIIASEPAPSTEARPIVNKAELKPGSGASTDAYQFDPSGEQGSAFIDKLYGEGPAEDKRDRLKSRMSVKTKTFIDASAMPLLGVSDNAATTPQDVAELFALMERPTTPDREVLLQSGPKSQAQTRLEIESESAPDKPAPPKISPTKRPVRDRVEPKSAADVRGASAAGKPLGTRSIKLSRNSLYWGMITLVVLISLAVVIMLREPPDRHNPGPNIEPERVEKQDPVVKKQQPTPGKPPKIKIPPPSDSVPRPKNPLVAPKQPPTPTRLSPDSKTPRPAPLTLVVTIHTDPVGAMLFVANKRVGSTPRPLLFQPEQRKAVLRLKLAGYRTLVKVVDIDKLRVKNTRELRLVLLPVRKRTAREPKTW